MTAAINEPHIQACDYGPGVERLSTIASESTKVLPTSRLCGARAYMAPPPSASTEAAIFSAHR